VIVAFVIASVHRDLNHSSKVEDSAEGVARAFNVAMVAPGDERIAKIIVTDPDPFGTLKLIRVSDYLRSGDVRRQVDQALPTWTYRRHFLPPICRPQGNRC
jgi:hypothetical protein